MMMMRWWDWYASVGIVLFPSDDFCFLVIFTPRVPYLTILVYTSLYTAECKTEPNPTVVFIRCVYMCICGVKLLVSVKSTCSSRVIYLWRVQEKSWWSSFRRAYSFLPTMISLLVVSLDFKLSECCTPATEHSSFQNREPNAVIRLFGSTDRGLRICAHIHGV